MGRDRLLRWLACFGALALAACNGIGPTVIARDRMDYAEALAQTGKREMLLNIVRLRYGDMPTLLPADQLVTGYSLEGRINLGTDWFYPSFDLRDDVEIGVGGTFSNHPTISYRTVRGSEYARTMLAPLPPDELLAMMIAGVPVDATLGLAVKSINGLGQDDEAHAEMLALFRELREQGILGTHFEGRGVDRRVFLVIDDSTDPEHDARIRRLLRLLRLDPALRRFQVVFGFGDSGGDEIAIYTRSLYEILGFLAAEIEVPPPAVAAGRTYATSVTVDRLSVPLRVRAVPRRPEDAFVAVDYGGHWYFIDDGDFGSKRAFGVLMLLAAIMEGAQRSSTVPVIAIPAG